MTSYERFIFVSKLGMLFFSMFFFSIMLLCLAANMYDATTAFGVASIATYTVGNIGGKE